MSGEKEKPEYNKPDKKTGPSYTKREGVPPWEDFPSVAYPACDVRFKEIILAQRGELWRDAQLIEALRRRIKLLEVQHDEWKRIYMEALSGFWHA